jgi:hypothetical protein
MVVSYLDYSLTLKMEATYAYEMAVEFQRTTRPCIPEDRILSTYKASFLKCSGTGKFSLIVILQIYICGVLGFNLGRNNIYYH